MESFTPPPDADALPVVTGVTRSVQAGVVAALMGRLLRMSDNCAAAREAFQ